MLQGSSTMKARTGREKQVYKGCIRQVAGCVPINKKTGEILLITRRKKGGGWVLPKGGWENDESEEEAAARETYEEAGARGRIVSLIGVWQHHVIKTKTGLPKAEFSFFEMEVDKLEERWPEMDERDRQWFSYDDALKALIKPFMREVVERCSLAPLPDNNNNNNIIVNHLRTEKVCS
ncbi:NUDIX hydrolase domain-like protein [Glomus cerebriforme]|uniref:NUDIX hydrolase domain-like protein n=1 Tax=Glomus cerebriforme TaxID=658196 RepID=A0A397TDH2_9GLOM|nr:NUDIX hydrolase domain-like protein [Glomus cerebriforme]